MLLALAKFFRIVYHRAQFRMGLKCFEHLHTPPPHIHTAGKLPSEGSDFGGHKIESNFKCELHIYAG